MGCKYYISVRPQTNDLHAVHKEGCPFLPDDSKRIFLGEFKTSRDAVRKGSMHFSGVKQCLYCCKEKQGSVKKITEPVIASRCISSVAPASYLQAMICCIN